MEYWAKPGLDRLQALLFYPTLDESISQDHPVRASEEILRELDWSAWVQEYNGHVGQPPIPPWVMAGVILYGLIRRIRSSRQLEYACGNNFDFIYDAEANCYYCPLGRVLGFEQTKREKGRETRYVYRCKDCEGARWRGFAATQTPSGGEAFRGTSTNPCGSGCTPRCRPRRRGRPTTGGCTSARPRLRSSRTFSRCAVSSCEGWRRSARSGAGCVRPTT